MKKRQKSLTPALSRWERGKRGLILVACILLGVGMAWCWLWLMGILSGYCMGVEGCV